MSCVRGADPVNSSQYRIKVPIIKILKLNLGVNSGQGWVTDQEGQPGLIRDNVMIKFVLS